MDSGLIFADTVAAGHRNGCARLYMPSFADALNRIGFFSAAGLFGELLHCRLKPFNGERVHMVVDQLPGNA